VNTNRKQRCPALEEAEARRVLAAHMAELEGRSPGTRSVYRSMAGKFIQEFCGLGARAVFDAPGLLRWLARDCKGRSIRHAAQRLGAVGRYLSVLHRMGLITVDLLGQLKADCGRDWRTIARALKSRDPRAALAALRTPPPSPGPLQRHVRSYVALHQSLGKKYRTHQLALLDLDRHLRAEGVRSPRIVKEAMIQRWLGTMTCTPTVRTHKARFARRFFDHLRGIGIVRCNPMSPSRFSEARTDAPAFRPFIFSRVQVSALLARARRLPPSDSFPMRASVCHLMLAMLYSLGLRHSEARLLRVCDVDLGKKILFISETKFHKSRLVPMGAKLGECLRQYLGLRRKTFPRFRDEDSLFITCWRTPPCHHALMRAFRDCLRADGVSAGAGRRPPRLHDLRHTFAVHRLLRWYREGVDVQVRLPALATFMGHVELTSTEVYLTITLDLLQEASGRFHGHFGRPFDREVHP
jgi:integrase/recombinase XerD